MVCYVMVCYVMLWYVMRRMEGFRLIDSNLNVPNYMRNAVSFTMVFFSFCGSTPHHCWVR